MTSKENWPEIVDINVKAFAYDRKLTENILMVITGIVQNVSIILLPMRCFANVVVQRFEGSHDKK